MADKWAQYQTPPDTAPPPDKWAQYQAAPGAVTPVATPTTSHGVTGSWESNASPGRGGGLRNLASTPLSNATKSVQEDEALANMPMGGYGPPKVLVGVNNVLTPGRRARGISQIVKGGSDILMPLLPEALLSKPVSTIAAMITSSMAGEAGRNVSKWLGGDPETQDATSDLSSLLTLTPTGEHPLLPSLRGPSYVERPPPFFPEGATYESPGGPGTTRPAVGSGAPVQRLAGLGAAAPAAAPNVGKGAGKMAGGAALGYLTTKLPIPEAALLALELGPGTIMSRGGKQVIRGLGEGLDAYRDAAYGPELGPETKPKGYKAPTVAKGRTKAAPVPPPLDPMYERNYSAYREPPGTVSTIHNSGIQPVSSPAPLEPPTGSGVEIPDAQADPAGHAYVTAHPHDPEPTFYTPDGKISSDWRAWSDRAQTYYAKQPVATTTPAPVDLTPPVRYAASDNYDPRLGTVSEGLRPPSGPTVPDYYAPPMAPVYDYENPPYREPIVTPREAPVQYPANPNEGQRSEPPPPQTPSATGPVPPAYDPWTPSASPRPEPVKYPADPNEGLPPSAPVDLAPAPIQRAAPAVATTPATTTPAAAATTAPPAPQNLTPQPTQPIPGAASGTLKDLVNVVETHADPSAETIASHSGHIALDRTAVKNLTIAQHLLDNNVTPEQWSAMSPGEQNAWVKKVNAATGKNYDPFGSNLHPGGEGRDHAEGVRQTGEVLKQLWAAQPGPIKAIEPAPTPAASAAKAPVAPAPAPAPVAAAPTPAPAPAPSTMDVARTLFDEDWTPEDIDKATDKELDGHYAAQGSALPPDGRADLKQALTRLIDGDSEEAVKPLLPAGSSARRVSVGLIPGHGTPFETAGIKEIPLDAARWGVQQIANKTGVKIRSFHSGLGAFQSETEPSMHLQVEGTPAQIQQFMDATGYGFQQTSVIATAPSPHASSYAFDVFEPEGKGLETDEARFELYRDLNRELKAGGHDPGAMIPGFQPISIDGKPGIRFLQFGEHMTPETIEALESALDAVREGFKTRHGAIDILETGNDWKEQPNGEEYTSRLSRLANGTRQYLDGEYRRAFGERIRPPVPEGTGAAPKGKGGQGSGGKGGGSNEAPAERRGPVTPPLPKGRGKFDANGQRNDLKPGPPS